MSCSICHSLAVGRPWGCGWVGKGLSMCLSISGYCDSHGLKPVLQRRSNNEPLATVIPEARCAGPGKGIWARTTGSPGCKPGSPCHSGVYLDDRSRKGAWGVLGETGQEGLVRCSYGPGPSNPASFSRAGPREVESETQGLSPVGGQPSTLLQRVPAE